MSETIIDSFMVRFVHQPTPKIAKPPSWHGTIRHIQSNHETRFTDLGEALTFMTQFVDFGYGISDWRNPSEIKNQQSEIKNDPLHHRQ